MATDNYIAYGNFNENKMAGALNNPSNINIYRTYYLYKDYNGNINYAKDGTKYSYLTINNSTVSAVSGGVFPSDSSDVWKGPNDVLYYSSGSSGTGIQYYLDENNEWQPTSWKARTLGGTTYTIDNSYHSGAYPMLQGNLIWKIASGTTYTIMSYREGSTVKTGFFYLGANQFWYEAYQLTSTSYTKQWEVFYVRNNTFKWNNKWTYDSDLGRYTWKSYTWYREIGSGTYTIDIVPPFELNGSLYTYSRRTTWQANQSITFYVLNKSTMHWEVATSIKLPSDFPEADTGPYLHIYVYNNAVYYINGTYFTQIPIE